MQRRRDRSFERVHIWVHYFVRHRPSTDVETNTRTGTMQVITPEVTVLDLVAAPDHGGGISNVATVVGELLDRDSVDESALKHVSEGYLLGDPIGPVVRSALVVRDSEHENLIFVDRVHDLVVERANTHPTNIYRRTTD